MFDVDDLMDDVRSLMNRAYDAGYKAGVEEGKRRALAVATVLASTVELDGNHEFAAALRMVADHLQEMMRRGDGQP